MFLVHLSLQLTVDGFAIDKMAAEVKVRASDVLSHVVQFYFRKSCFEINFRNILKPILKRIFLPDLCWEVLFCANLI